MDIVYLIGNGFDVNAGLQTNYSAFYEEYNKIATNNVIIAKLKESIKEYMEKKDNKELLDSEINWADLELALGKYCKNFHSKLEFDMVFKDILRNLADYLQKEEESVIIGGDCRNIISKGLIEPNRYMSEVGAHILTQYFKQNISSRNIKIITYNYTRIVEKIFDWGNSPIFLGSNGNNNYLTEIQHIHGFTDRRMVLGVNDESQVNNSELIKNKYFRNAFIKKECNNAQGTLHKQRCEELISNAQLICMFGVSIGATDADWWKAVAKSVHKNNAKLVIFKHTRREVNGIFSYERDEIIDETKEKFLTAACVDDSIKEKIIKNIIVEVNANIFNIKLLKKEEEKIA